MRVENRREGRVVFERRILAKNNDRRQTSSKVKALLGWVSIWMADHLQTEVVVLNTIFAVTRKARVKGKH